MDNYLSFIEDSSQILSIVCHRGLWGPAPENSIAAIEQAIEKGFPIVEIDVRQDLNGEFYLLHDAIFDRTTNLSGPIRNCSLKDITRPLLFAGDGISRQITDQKLPSLFEVLETFKKQIFFDIDVKNRVERIDLIKFINQHKFANYVDIKKPILSIGDALSFVNEEEENDIIKMVVLEPSDQSLDEIMSILKITKPKIVEINYNTINTFETVASFAKQMGVSVWVNTIDDVASCGLTDSLAMRYPDRCWGYLKSHGVNIIQTDIPLVLKDYLLNKTHKV